MIVKYKLIIAVVIFTLPLVVCSQDHTNSLDSIVLNQIAQADSIRRNHREYDKTLHILNKLIERNDFSHASNSAKSNAFHKIGVTHYSKREFKKAINFMNKAVFLRESASKINIEDLTNSIFLRGLFKQNLRYFELALLDFKKAISYLENYPNDFNASLYGRKKFDYYTQMAIACRNLNELFEAKKYYSAAKRNVKDVNSKTAVARFYSGFGVLYVDLEDKDNAFEMYENALSIYRELGENRYLKGILDVENNIALAHVKFKEYEKANAQYEIALKRIKDNKARYTPKEFTRRMGICNRNLAFTETKLGNYFKANNYYNAALEFAFEENASSYSPAISAAYEGLADVDLAKKKWNSALSNYQESTKSLCYNFAPENDLTLPILSQSTIIDKKSLKRVLSLKANTLQEKYAATRDDKILKATYSTFQTLDTLITQIRQSYESDLSRYDIIEGTIPIYEKAALSALQLYQINQDKKYLQAAFDFASKNKAIVLLEDQQDEEAKYAGIPAELLKEEKELKKEYYSLEQEIFKLEAEPEKNKILLDSVKQVRFQSSRNYEKLIANFEENYPEYHQLKYANQKSINIAQLQSALPADAAMIEYFIGLENILIFTLSESGLQHYSTAKPADFDELCKSYRQQSERQGNAVSLSVFAEKSSSLYQMLLAKPLQDLAGQGINRLFVIPDDYLHELSFDAFLSQPLTEQQLAAGWGVGNLPYLLRSHAISYVYSNRLLYDYHHSANQSRGSKKLFAGFGLDYRDEDYVDVADNSIAMVSRSWRDKIRPLPYAVEEIEKIGEQLGGDTWLNENATKVNFEKYASDYKILHLAMHGLVEKNQPLNSALIFDKRQDSLNYLLTAGDLYSTTLKADMVVLSACDTGAGQLQKGEGAMTLARAFNYAGCPSLVASLWSAADEPTKDLMIAFYTHLQAGHPKDVALQMAKINHLDQGLSPSVASPHYWSHLAIIGNTSPISFSSGIMKYLLIGLVMSIVLILFWRFAKR